LGANVSAAKTRATSRIAIWSASSANCVDPVEIESSMNSHLPRRGPLLHCRFAAANGVFEPSGLRLGRRLRVEAH
jgi:hypothetical protein